MRYAELSFLALLVLYHAVLLLPRHRRPFSANYLIFVAGMALAWNLGLEGLRWQTIPGIALMLFDLLVLFPTFATLRGSLPVPGFFSALGAFFRTLVSLAALLIALASALLSVAFPLPKVDLTGGVTPSYRVVRFPAEKGHAGLELQLWYPASGELKSQPRANAEAESWARIQAAGGLPVFWQSYLEHLPTNAILGGRLASPKTQYPVIWAAVPPGQNPGDFGYLFEDLASRGFVVAAGSAALPPLPPAPPFEWSAAWTNLIRPLEEPALWLQPESSWKDSRPDYRTLGLAQEALRQLSREPGDAFFEAVDWSKQGLWTWGSTPALSAEQKKALGLRVSVHAGSAPQGAEPGFSLWISPSLPEGGPAGRWTLTVTNLLRADLADAAYLKPYLAFFGLKSQADSGPHGAVRQYQAAFYQYAFWNSNAPFGQTVPDLPGLRLTGR